MCDQHELTKLFCSNIPLLLSMAATCSQQAMTEPLGPTPAFGFPPSRQSSKLNRDWRTGLEKATRLLSTKVMWRTPQARRVRATEHPSVPAPDDSMHSKQQIAGILLCSAARAISASVYPVNPQQDSLERTNQANALLSPQVPPRRDVTHPTAGTLPLPLPLYPGWVPPSTSSASG
jgi:hypothetical protein